MSPSPRERWLLTAPPVCFPPQADLNSTIQDGPGTFYGVSSQYSSAENMTITVSTKVCSFGKQVVEKVEVSPAGRGGSGVPAAGPGSGWGWDGMGKPPEPGVGHEGTTPGCGFFIPGP